MVRKYVDFEWHPLDDQYEILFYINNKPRRFALCPHQNDAETIVEALKTRYPEGFTVYPPQRTQNSSPCKHDGAKVLLPNGARCEDCYAEIPTQNSSHPKGWAGAIWDGTDDDPY